MNGARGVGHSMTATTASRILRIVAAAAMTIAAFAGFGSHATAGGWAIASLESMPTAEAGATVDVSFTILQHGVTPVDLDEGVGIEIRDPEGSSAFFPAVGEGTTGQYVAEVTFPETAGTYEWQVRMGWFGPHELGALDVRPPESDTLTGWSTIRWLALGGSLLLAGVAVADLAASRRRRLALG